MHLLPKSITYLRTRLRRLMNCSEERLAATKEQLKEQSERVILIQADENGGDIEGISNKPNEYDRCTAGKT